MAELLDSLDDLFRDCDSATLAVMTYDQACQQGLPAQYGPRAFANMQRLIVQRRVQSENSVIRAQISAKLDDEERAWLDGKLAELEEKEVGDA